MLETLQRGDRILSLVGGGRSHPSVSQAVELVGTTFHEVQSLPALEQALRQERWQMLVITPLRRSMYHVPAAAAARATALAKAAGQLMFVDTERKNA